MDLLPSPEVHIEFVYAPLSPESVRWFSYRAPYDIKELSKATEIPHRGSLLRFCEADSAALEAAYRSRHDELERFYWEEEAELQKGPDGLPAPPAAIDGWSYFMGSDCADDEPRVQVRSGAFEVDLRCRQLRPCYWPASRHRVLRGTWFAEKGGEWVPLKESLAEQLEEGYRQSIWLPQRGRLQPQTVGGGYAARLELTTHIEKGLYALFVSEDEVFLSQDTGWGWLRKIGASSTAGQQRLRLRRGYEQPGSKALLEKEADLRQEELDEACAAAPVSRLVLVVHGIGQKLEGANVAQDASSFRSVLRQVAQDQSQQGLLDEQAAAGRTEVLPVQWRKHLVLEADHLSRQLMPPGIPALRQVLHSTVVEILLFMTPRHRAEIVASLVASLNTAYRRFMRRNRHFKGSVSILSHSLGTVLCYDLLCAQPLSPQLVDGASLLPHTAPEAAGSPQGQAMQSLPSTPPRPPLRSAGQSPGGSRGRSRAEGGDDMAIDLTADSPTAAMQQELSRLRGENQRLQLQLEVARAQGSFGGSLPESQMQQSPPPTDQAVAAEQSEAAEWPGLQFSVDTLIMLGSPLGCFLALRGVSEAKGTGLGTAASAPLMQLAPGQPFSPDGLPAVRRLLNVYHPYDPVAHRIEPLTQPHAHVQRPAFVSLFKGGKRIHLAVQEFSEDVGSAASRFGTSLLSSLAFAKFKGSATYKAQHGGGQGSSSGTAAADAAAAAAEAAAEAAEALAEEEAVRRLTGNKSAPDLGGGDSFMGEAQEEQQHLQEGRLYASLSFGVMDQSASGTVSAEASAAATSPTRRRQGAGPLATALEGGSTCSGIARVADGLPVPGGRSAQGRLDFVMQESSLENQYLSALSAHFVYWTSVDVALFVLRAVHGLDVVTGASKQQGEAADQAPAAAAVEAFDVQPAGKRVMEPTSPRQHLIALP